MSDDDVLLRRIEALGAEVAKANAERDEAIVAMAKAREIRRDTMSDADLWKFSIDMGDHSPLLVKVWKRAKSAETDLRGMQIALDQSWESNRARQAEIDHLRTAMGSACDLLAERKFGSPARSPAHNARVVMEYALQTTTGTTDTGSGE